MNQVNALQEINNQIFFLGTMHIAAESARMVEKSITTIKPNCVMLELDQVRLQELMAKKETPKPSLLSSSTEEQINQGKKKKIPNLIDFGEAVRISSQVSA